MSTNTEKVDTINIWVDEEKYETRSDQTVLEFLREIERDIPTLVSFKGYKYNRILQDLSCRRSGEWQIGCCL